MGKRLNVPQPAVINTELAPFDESFFVEPDGQLEQWYYDNTNTYAPHRPRTPLTLTPKLSVFDSDTNQSFVPSFFTVQWYVNEYKNNGYVESEITNVDDGDNVDYVIVGNKLKVKKNVPYTRAIQIRCRATYIDPRDAGVTYVVEDTLTLSTNRDASVIYPSLDVACANARAYNPLTDDSSTFTFVAIANKGGQDVTNSVYFVWYAINGTTEVLAETMPWYVSGQNTDTLTVDAMYGEEIRVVLRAKENAQAATLYPDKAYRTITWVIPDVDTNVISENGGAVRADTYKMAFSTVVNVRHQILSDEKKHAHLRFNWKYRKSNSSTEYDAGWGENIEILASQLRNVYGSGATLASTVVYPYVYVLGAYDVITHDGATVTHDGETVYERSIYD